MTACKFWSTMRFTVDIPTEYQLAVTDIQSAAMRDRRVSVLFSGPILEIGVNGGSRAAITNNFYPRIVDYVDCCISDQIFYRFFVHRVAVLVTKGLGMFEITPKMSTFGRSAASLPVGLQGADARLEWIGRHERTIVIPF